MTEAATNPAGCSGVDTPDPTLDLAAIEARATAATSGPWEHVVGEGSHLVRQLAATRIPPYPITRLRRDNIGHCDAEFIAAMDPTTALALVAEVVLLRTEVETARTDERAKIVALIRQLADEDPRERARVAVVLRSVAARLVREAPE